MSFRTLLFLLTLAFGVESRAGELAVTGGIKGADGGWDYATVDAERHVLYVARGDGIMAVNLESGAVTPHFAPGKRSHGIQPLPGGLVLSTSGEPGSAILFNAADGAVVAEIPAGRKPDAVAYDKKSGLVAVMNSQDGTVLLVDPARKAAAGAIAVGGTLEFAVADGKGKIFVNVEDRSELVVLDISARKVAARYKLGACEEPTGLAMDEDSHLLLAACGNGKAVAVSAETGKVVATVPIGAHPDAALFDKAHNRFLVPCGEGVLTVIEEKDGALSVAGSVPTAKGARTGALDPSSGKVYLPTADFTPAKEGERPAALPGSFRILVLDGSK